MLSHNRINVGCRAFRRNFIINGDAGIEPVDPNIPWPAQVTGLPKCN